MQRVNLFEPLEATHVGPAPYVIRTVVTTTNSYVAGGMPTEAKKIEDYVLLSSLPKELQERVRTSIQTMLSSI